MDILANNGFRAHAYDQRGHGESGGSPADGLNAFGDDAAAMIQQLDKPVVVGGSLGGFALMLALATCEPFVSGLVLVDVTPKPDPEKTRRYLSPRGELGASPIVSNILSQTDRVAEIVSKFSLPMMFAGGGQKSPIDKEARAAFLSLCSHLRIEVIEHAGHLVARDAPAELAHLIVDFANDATKRPLP